MPQPRVLVVDDEIHAREVCVDFLDDTGFQVESCGNGKEAIDLLARSKFQILLSDIQMPEMDGISLLKEAKRLYPHLEVILMTAYGGLPSAVEALRFGAYDYLTKPLSRDFLLNTLRRCNEKIELKEQLRESQDKLVEHERLAAVGTVASWLSHRMRNSLSVILMCAHYLNQKMPESAGGDFKEIVGAIIDKIRSLEITTSDLIDFSRAYEPQMVSEDINRVLDATLSSIMVQIQIQEVALEKKLAVQLPSVLCDPHLLQEAFENLLVNALQAIGDQKGQSLLIHSECRTVGEKKEVFVFLQNSGSEIAAGNELKVFAPFFTTKDSGSGLGLAITKKTIEQHGGKITARSFLQDGRSMTEFCITLPVSDRG